MAYDKRVFSGAEWDTIYVTWAAAAPPWATDDGTHDPDTGQRLSGYERAARVRQNRRERQAAGPGVT